MVCASSWNILADSLSHMEFMTYTGDDASTAWLNRGPRVVNVCKEILSRSALLITQENDHFFEILHSLRQSVTSVEGLFCLEKSVLSELDFTSERLSISSRDCSKQPYDRKANIEARRQWCAEAYSRLVRAGTRPSFRDEQVPDELAVTRLACLGLSSDGPVGDLPSLCPPGLGIYWDSSQLELIKVHSSFVELPNSSPATIVGTGSKSVILEFRVLLSASSLRLLVAGAHLKSGEDAAGERTRVEELTTILGQMQEIQSTSGAELVPLVLMDSNSDKAYGNAVPSGEPTVSSVIAAHGMTDVVCEKLKCVKMRHAMGGQPKKYGELMVDGIDKILVPQKKTDKCIFDSRPLRSFQLTPGWAERALNEIRSDPIKRQFLKRLCVGKRALSVSWCKAMKIPFKLGHEGDNVHSVHAGEPWGPCMKDNCEEIEKYSSVLKAQVELTLGIPYYQLCSALHMLYPNVRAPSDHPPVTVEIRLS